MKFGYRCNGQFGPNVYELVLIQKVEKLKEDLIYTSADSENEVFSKKQWVLVETYRDAFSEPTDGPLIERRDLSYYGLFPKDHVFDSARDLMEWAKKNGSPMFISCQRRR